MKVFIKSDIRDNLGELTELTERVIILLDDIMNNALYPLENGKETKSPLNLAALAVANAHPAIVKAEIANSILENMKDKLEALHKIADPRPLEADEIPLATSADDPEKVWPTKAPTQPTEEAAEPVKGADKLARDDIKENMIAEYMASINDFVSVIESKEDFIDRMNELKRAAQLLATKSTTAHIIDDSSWDVNPLW